MKRVSSSAVAWQVGVLAALLAAVLIAIALTTPWHPLGATMPVPPSPVDPALDFTSAQIAREEAFHAALRPWSYASMGVGILVPLLLGLTPAGAWLIETLARPLGGGWWWRVLAGVVALTLVGRLVSLPLGARAEVVLRRYGLSTQTWGGWVTDAAKQWALTAGLLLVVASILYAVVRAAPTWWWVWLSGGAAVLVCLLSFAYPVLIEPVFNTFRPMEPGPLRTSLLDLARRDGVPVRDVLVADASRRTTSLNAYVSGFGSTRRIVVYDTLLREAPPRQVEMIVAHELGHAKRQDVVTGTLVGALGAGAAVPLLALALGWAPLLRRAGIDAGIDAGVDVVTRAGAGVAAPRSLALLLAVVTVVGLVVAPVSSLVSRRVEARADIHALDLTADPATFVAMQRNLAVTNLSDLDPPRLLYLWQASHPTAPQRIALARDWARLRAVAVPPPMAGR